MFNFTIPFGKKPPKARTVFIGPSQQCHNEMTKQTFPPNIIRNQKYNILTFLPIVLFNQFKFFLNLFFLVMSCSQFIRRLQVGELYTYWAPLGFVLGVTLLREAIDDFFRFRRDKAVNSQCYQKLNKNGAQEIPSSNIKVGDLIVVSKDQRVPADMVFLRTSEKNGACFVRTDQLDGETDWKLRLAVPETQSLESDEQLFTIDALIDAEAPQKDIHSFTGRFVRKDSTSAEASDDLSFNEISLNIENTLWTNTVVASGTAIGIVIYTGPETRSVMNNNEPRSKVGLLDYELNSITKILFCVVAGLALAMICLKGFKGSPFVYWVRFVLLFSYIIPISLRVNLEIGRVVYSYMISRDFEIPGTIVRSSTIPEDLGRISYLLTDKTGTLTKNEMVFKQIHLGKLSYSPEFFDELGALLKAYYSQQTGVPIEPNNYQRGHRRQSSNVSVASFTVERRQFQSLYMRLNSYEVDWDSAYRVQQAVLSIALCHNVTPSYESGQDPYSSKGSLKLPMETELEMPSKQKTITYQASSPDEVALVQWTEQVGLTLEYRDLTSMKLRDPNGNLLCYDILQLFPFSSETKRMGIIVRDQSTDEIMFILKGADTVMTSIIVYSDWLQEQCDNMARSGLRTLVVAKKSLTAEQYKDFAHNYNQAKCSMIDRNAKMSSIVASIEKDMELLCLTGVEDRLQNGVPQTLKGLQDAGIRIWMLTGDKLETAISIAKSSQLVKKMQEFHIFPSIKDRIEANNELNNIQRKNDCPLIIRGEDLELCLEFYSTQFIQMACQCPAVVCCRCSPTQKAKVVKLIKDNTKMVTCAIGDGGNDVSMIQTADVGVGIVGKEGQQASLAADFSLTQFSHIYRLIILHGRYSYKRSAALSQFIIHRGLIVSTIQAIFSSVFYFVPILLFQGFLLIGYATVYTMFPVFSLVLDKDVSPRLVMEYPELYKLMKGRSLTYKTFFIWVLISLYQGGVIMYGALLVLFKEEFIHVVAISFTSLILTELLMLALTVRTWHWLMIVAELLSLATYLMTVLLMPQFFDDRFIQNWHFLWKLIVLTLLSCLPLYAFKYLQRKIAPPSHSKLK